MQDREHGIKQQEYTPCFFRTAPTLAPTATMPSAAQYAVLVAAGVLSRMADMHACGGGDLVNQNFDKYGGEWRVWTYKMAQEEFPRDAEGNGIMFVSRDTTHDVGHGMLRANSSQGKLPYRSSTKYWSTLNIYIEPLPADLKIAPTIPRNLGTENKYLVLVR